MKRLHFDYYMQIDYTVQVEKCYFTIKCIPKNNARQVIGNIDIELFPSVPFNRGVDGLGNLQIYGTDYIPHEMFYFKISGDARVGASEYEEKADEAQAMIFRHPHGLNVAGDSIKDYYKKINPLGCVKDFSVLVIAEYVMNCLYRDYVYQPGVTNVDTSAEEAFSGGKGVCQDYAHIFIALMHLSGITARYVTGLIVGEGASHAWVEVLSNGYWYGFDPTNNKRINDEHIKIGVGRDAKDCMINRGIMRGGGLHTQSVSVNVIEKDG